MPEDKSNKQQNQASHCFHWQPNQIFSTDLIFHSQQIWCDKKTQFSPVVNSCALSIVLSI